MTNSRRQIRGENEQPNSTHHFIFYMTFLNTSCICFDSFNMNEKRDNESNWHSKRNQIIIYDLFEMNFCFFLLKLCTTNFHLNWNELFRFVNRDIALSGTSKRGMYQLLFSFHILIKSYEYVNCSFHSPSFVCLFLLLFFSRLNEPSTVYNFI